MFPFICTEMQVDFAVFEFVERVYSFEFIVFHIKESRNIYPKNSMEWSLSFAGSSSRIQVYVMCLCHVLFIPHEKQNAL